MFFVYIIEAVESKRYYVGQTVNLEERLYRHNQGINPSTRYYIPWQLKWWKGYETRAEAVRIERKLKSIKKRIGIEKYVRVNEFSGCGAVG